METVTYKHVQDLFAAITPVTLSNGALGTDDAAAFGRLFSRLARYGWERYFWPALMLFEERFYRDDYAAGTTYAADDQVYYATTGKYYTALQATTGNAPTNATYWEEETSIDAYVGFEQAGETAFTHVKEVWNANYRTTNPARRVKWEYDERGIRLTETTVPASAWVYFRKRCPVWRGSTYSEASTYAAGDIVYYASGSGSYEGDYWTCLSATSAGNDPIDTPAKWERIEIPSFLADFIAGAISLAFIKGETELSWQLLRVESEIWAPLNEERAKLLPGMPVTASVGNLI